MLGKFKKAPGADPKEPAPLKKRHPLLCISGMLVWSFIISVDTTCLAVALPVCNFGTMQQLHDRRADT